MNWHVRSYNVPLLMDSLKSQASRESGVGKGEKGSLVEQDMSP